MTISPIATTSINRTSRASSSWSWRATTLRRRQPGRDPATSVAGPIATTIPSPRPPTTLVPEYAIDRRSARVLSTGPGSTTPGSGIDSPVSTLRSRTSRSARVKRMSAGTTSPTRNRTMSPGTTPRCFEVHHSALAPDPCPRGGCRPKSFERLLASILRCDFSSHKRDEAGQDQQAVPQLADERGTDAGDEQHENERLHDGPDDHPPQPRLCGSRDGVRSGARRSRGRLILAETTTLVDPGRRGDGVDAQRMSIRDESRLDRRDIPLDRQACLHSSLRRSPPGVIPRPDRPQTEKRVSRRLLRSAPFPRAAPPIALS